MPEGNALEVDRTDHMAGSAAASDLAAMYRCLISGMEA